MAEEKSSSEMTNRKSQRDVTQALDEMEETFEDTFGRPFFPVAYGREPEVRFWSPATEIFDIGGSYLVRLEVPGVEREDINITATGDTVKVTGNRKQEEGIKGENFTLCERCYGPFERMLTFQTPIDPDRIQAWLENGMLRIQVPMVPEQMAKKIEIGGGTEEQTGTAQPRAEREYPLEEVQSIEEPSAPMERRHTPATPMSEAPGSPVNQGQEVRAVSEMVDREGLKESPFRNKGTNLTERAARLVTDSHRPEQSKGEAPGEGEISDEWQIAEEESARQSRTKPTTRE